MSNLNSEQRLEYARELFFNCMLEYKQEEHRRLCKNKLGLKDDKLKYLTSKYKWTKKSL